MVSTSLLITGPPDVKKSDVSPFFIIIIRVTLGPTNEYYCWKPAGEVGAGRRDLVREGTWHGVDSSRNLQSPCLVTQKFRFSTSSLQFLYTGSGSFLYNAFPYQRALLTSAYDPSTARPRTGRMCRQGLGGVGSVS